MLYIHNFVDLDFYYSMVRVPPPNDGKISSYWPVHACARMGRSTTSFLGWRPDAIGILHYWLFIYPLYNAPMKQTPRKKGNHVMRLIAISASFLLALLCFSHPALSLEMPIPPMQRATQVDVSAQIARLEQLVASLQQQVALLQSVIKISGNGVEITSDHDLKIKAARTVDINADIAMYIRSSGSTKLLSSGDTFIKSSTLDLSSSYFRLSGTRGEISAASEMLIKGAILKLNKGTKPVATVGSMIGGNQVVTGSQTIYGE